VIAGVGVCTPVGGDAATWALTKSGGTWLSMREVGGATDFPLVPGAIAAESLEGFLQDRKLAKYMSPAARMAVIAAGRALGSAGLLRDSEALRTMGLFAATGLIAFDLESVQRAIEVSQTADGDLSLAVLGSEGLRACHPLMPFKMLLNMSLGLVSIAYGLRGPNFVTYPDAVQAGFCLERAVRGIRTGRYERAMIGGTSQGFSLMPLCTRAAEDGLATTLEAAEPFSPSHAGTAPADAAAFVVVEDERSCRARGATPMAVVGDAGVPCSMEPKVVLVTGTRSAAEDEAVLASIREEAGAREVHVVSFDASWGDTAAASLTLSLGAAVEMLRTAEVWPMPWREARVPPPMLLVCPDAAAKVRPGAFEVRASNGVGGTTIATFLPWEGAS
jgi:3-oxoacyl-(acyl-carrier-protein) synthase